MVRHTKEDAVDDRKFEELVAATYSLDEYYAVQCRFVLFVLGRCGLRAGELTHLKEEDIDWRERVIHIPSHRNCDCGYCKNLAEQKVDHDDHDFEYHMSEMWSPKTDAAVRTVPFDFEPRVEMSIEDFFDKFDEWTWSRQSVNRRVDKVTDEIDFDDRFYPHALRATAATYHIYRGVGPIPLQSMFGWANIGTAMNYIRRSGKNTAKEVRKAHM